MIRSIAAVLCLVALATPRAQAQNPQPAPPGVVHPPMAPPNAPSPPPEKIAPPDKDAQSGTMSDRLAKQHGTLQPPSGVDPGMTVNPPANAQGAMPVIPPPGSPGGNPKVQPK
jgi:hypothetical protein